MSFLFAMTDTITSKNIDLSSWMTLYIIETYVVCVLSSMLRVCTYGMVCRKEICIYLYITEKGPLGVPESVEMKYLQRITK